jgi:UPF0042 nucleotide-binding protein
LILGRVTESERLEPRVIIVTGMSGAGRSQAAKVLEDLRYFVVDNLPPTLIGDVVDRVGVAEGDQARMAAVVDTRGGVTAHDLDEAIRGLLSRGIRTTVLFLDADDTTLAKRFEETRRSHPIWAGSLPESIAEERDRFEEIRGMADVIIDTTDLSVHDLRRRIEGAFAEERDDRRMRVDVISFGFKRGVPRVVDLLFDVRFLPNPHWVPELRPYTGLDAAVSDYVLSSDDATEFVRQTSHLLEFLLPRYEAEGKKYLTIAIGCTGGKHRSVALAEELAGRIEGADVDVTVRHRDVPDGAGE